MGKYIKLNAIPILIEIIFIISCFIIPKEYFIYTNFFILFVIIDILLDKKTFFNERMVK